MRINLAGLLVLLILVACQAKATATPVAVTAAPYQTNPATLTPTVIPALTEITLPTPTTYTYTVAQGDTFISIAQKAGVTVQALQAANPGISATALSVGTKLVIPTGSQAPGEPTPTAAALPVLQAHCWPEATGGLWCFGLLQNTYAETLENISAQFALVDAGGQQLDSQMVYGLLDILPPGASMPLAAHFIAPVQNQAGVRVQVVTAIRLLPGDTRYLTVRMVNTLVNVDASGQTADVSGKVLLNGTGTANTVWVLASAYDADGNVVGVRRWTAPAALSASAPVSFEFQIASVGPGIARLEFLAEARP
jgi:LysM repeat protein